MVEIERIEVDTDRPSWEEEVEETTIGIMIGIDSENKLKFTEQISTQKHYKIKFYSNI